MEALGRVVEACKGRADVARFRKALRKALRRDPGCAHALVCLWAARALDAQQRALEGGALAEDEQGEGEGEDAEGAEGAPEEDVREHPELLLRDACEYAPPYTDAEALRFFARFERAAADESQLSAGCLAALLAAGTWLVRRFPGGGDRCAEAERCFRAVTASAASAGEHWREALDLLATVGLADALESRGAAEEARAALAAASASGCGAATWRLAQHAPADGAERCRLLELGAAQGDADCATALALLCTGSKRRKWLRVASLSGSVEAQYRLAEECAASDDSGDAPRLARLAAESGCAEAVAALAAAYDPCEPVDASERTLPAALRRQTCPQTDAARAAWLWRLAADGGLACASVRLANAAARGRAAESETMQHTQVRMWAQAAAQGNTEAAYVLGTLRACGVGCKRDLRAALACYRDAAARGHSEAQCTLASWYIAGDESQGGTDEAGGVVLVPDEAEGVRLYALAAEAGNPDAQFFLGTCYEEGLHGVPQDEARARHLYELADHQGYRDATERLAARGWLEELPSENRPLR
eukprot:TRINITY_DN9788_c0_g2_i1.p1 TRINITY_DN9788_c0_g2~~TRINITY_DN9788_c0_g2_i1.p1  ORF type:complete len:548 (+),score=126.49 TRINITY_DN9788_c0_g2_i1:43-1644(+)